MLALRTVLSLEEVLRILLVPAALPAQAAPPPPTAPPAQHANSAVNLPRPILQLAHCAASRLPTALLLAPQRSVSIGTSIFSAKAACVSPQRARTWRTNDAGSEWSMVL